MRGRQGGGARSRAPGRRRRGRRLAPALALGSVLALGAGCHAPAPHGDIVLVTVDTLRADHLSIYGYGRRTSPRLAQWFSDGAIYERAYSTSAFTTASTASLLTGLLPQQHGVRELDQIFPKDLRLLPTLLPPDYQTAAFVSTLILSNDGTGIAHAFEHFDDHIGESQTARRRERPAGPTTDTVLRWLREKRDPKRPLFLWVHYMDPHAPYIPPKDYADHFHREHPSGLTLDRIPPYARLEGASDPLDYVDRYDDEILYADTEIGRLLDGYAKLAPIDRALVIVTADHGETLVERRWWFVHAFQVFEEVVHVPLLLRGPGVTPGRHRVLASGVDVTPTILRFAGAPVPAGLEGHDLRDPDSIPADRTVFVESVNRFEQQVRAAIQGEHKWEVSVHAGDDRIENRRFYDLAHDPGERSPQRWQGDSGPGRELLELVKSDPDPAGKPRHLERGKLLENNRPLLKALGYVE